MIQSKFQTITIMSWTMNLMILLFTENIQLKMKIMLLFGQLHLVN